MDLGALVHGSAPSAWITELAIRSAAMDAVIAEALGGNASVAIIEGWGVGECN